MRAIYLPLGQFLAAGQGGAGKAELDSVQATQKAYWKVFWEQPEVADSIVNPSQRELMPMFKSMLATPQAQREHSQWNGRANFVGPVGMTGAFELWVSNDDALVPIAARFKVRIGSVKAELVKWKRGDWSPPGG